MTCTETKRKDKISRGSLDARVLSSFSLLYYLPIHQIDVGPISNFDWMELFNRTSNIFIYITEKLHTFHEKKKEAKRSQLLLPSPTYCCASFEQQPTNASILNQGGVE